MDKRYNVFLDHYNDTIESVFQSDKLEEALRYIADNISGVEYPSEQDNTTDHLYCYRLEDGCKTEDDGEGNMIPSEVFYTDYFYNN